MGAVSDWLETDPSAREHAQGQVDLGGKAVPDAVLDDPARLVELTKALAVEAIRRDAPEGVVEELLPAIRRMSRGVRALDRDGHIAEALRGAQGLRDRSELEPVLERAMETAPDAATRGRLALAIEAMKRADGTFAADEAILGPDETTTGGGSELSPTGCLICCPSGCVACGPLGCIPCCVVSCLVCLLE